MLWTTPINIIFALMINEFREKGVFHKSATTIAYLPHFLSGVVVISIFNQFLMPSGTTNQIIEKLGGTPLKFLSDPKYFRTIYNFICIWQETGWGSVIYVAALAGIDSSLYEAARMDGANKLQQIWHVSLPGIASTISIQFIMNLGYLLSGGTDRVMLLYNEKLYPTADIIGTYIYRVGLLNTDYSYSVAVGLFQSLIGLILGFRVVVSATGPQEKYEQALAGLTADGIEWRYIRCDIADHDSRLHLIEETIRQFGRIDVLVNTRASRRRCAPICWK